MSDKGRDGITVVLLARRPRLAIAMTKLLERSEIVDTVVRVDCPERVVETARAARADVVVMDADRPGCDLTELCRNLTQATNAKVMLLSTESESRQGPVRDALEAGAHSLLAWPFKPREFVLAVVHAAYRPGAGGLEALAEVEEEMRTSSLFSTTRLAPLLDWASHPTTGEISQRLRPDAKTS